MNFSFLFLIRMEEGLYRKRHSLSHILAQAIQREQQRDVEVAIGPAIDNGFYYDFLFAQDKQIKEEDLKKIRILLVLLCQMMNHKNSYLSL